MGKNRINGGRRIVLPTDVQFGQLNREKQLRVLAGVVAKQQQEIAMLQKATQAFADFANWLAAVGLFQMGDHNRPWRSVEELEAEVIKQRTETRAALQDPALDSLGLRILRGGGPRHQVETPEGEGGAA